MTLTEAIELIEDVRRAIEMDDSGIRATVVARCHGLKNSSLFKNLATESHWLNSMAVLTAISEFHFISADIFTSLAGIHDLLVIEHILKDWNEEFSFNFVGDNTNREGYRLEAEILKHVIDCLDWCISKNHLPIQDARDLFLGIFWEEGLTPRRYYNTEFAKPKKREVVKLFQSQNRRLMNVADNFENPFDKDAMPHTYRFSEICNTRSGQFDYFRRNRWYPLVKARKAWTTWYISNGTIATLVKNNEISFEHRGRSKNKIVKSAQKSRR